MNQETFERIGEHFYRRRYQTAAGEWRTAFYGIFVDWTGKRRKFALGSDEQAAREALAVLWADNLKRVDFDAEKERAREKARRMTFAQWAELYFAEMVNPNKRSIAWERLICEKRLEPYFGEMFLDEIDEAAIDGYREKRLREPVTKHKKPVKGSRVRYSTVNRELAVLRILLRLAKRKKKIKAVPEFDLASEKPLKRSRVVSEEEYRAILSKLERRWQRPVIGLYETAMRVGELLRLTWDRVDERAGVIRLRAEDVKEKAPRIVPISPALRAVLSELKAEQRQAKVKELGRCGAHVFTHKGLPIRTIRRAFELACKKAGVEDCHLHDFRHTCITRWAMAGIPPAAMMAAAGHHSLEMHDRYVNLNEHHLKEAFRVFPTCSQENRNEAGAVGNTLK